MTDPLPPLSDDDLSALLDGEAGPDVAARVDADPAARARLAELRAASAAVRTLPPVPALAATTVDDLVAQALAATDAPVEQPGAGPAAAPPADDAVVAPIRPAGGPAGVPRWLVAAVVVVLVAVGLGLVWSGRDTGSEDTAGRPAEVGRSADSPSAPTDAAGGADSAAPESDEGTASDVPDRNAEDPPMGAVPSTTVDQGEVERRGPVDVGTYGSVEELRTALRDGFPDDDAATPSGAEVPDQDEIDRCQEQMVQVFQQDLGIASPADEVGVAVVDDRTLLVFDFASVSAQAATEGQPTTFVTITDPGTCAAELSFERTPA